MTTRTYSGIILSVRFDRLFDLLTLEIDMGLLEQFNTSAKVLENIETLAITGVENNNHRVMVEVSCIHCARVIAVMSAAMYRMMRTELDHYGDMCESCWNGEDIRKARCDEPIRTEYELTPERLEFPSPTSPKAYFS